MVEKICVYFHDKSMICVNFHDKITIQYLKLILKANLKYANELKKKRLNIPKQNTIYRNALLRIPWQAKFL